MLAAAWTDEDKLAWCKDRAAARHWTQAIASIADDTAGMGIPLRPELPALLAGGAVPAANGK